MNQNDIFAMIVSVANDNYNYYGPRVAITWR